MRIKNGLVIQNDQSVFCVFEPKTYLFILTIVRTYFFVYCVLFQRISWALLYVLLYSNSWQNTELKPNEYSISLTFSKYLIYQL